MVIRAICAMPFFAQRLFSSAGPSRGMFRRLAQSLLFRFLRSIRFFAQALQLKDSDNLRNLYCSGLLGSIYIIDLHMFHRALWWFCV